MSLREFDEIPAFDQFTAWFEALTPDCRRALLTAPRDVVTTKFVDDIERIGHAVAAPWFTRSTTADPYRLPEDVAGQVEQIASDLEDWWNELDETDRTAWSSITETTSLTERHQATAPIGHSAVLGSDAQRYPAPVVVDFIAAASR